MKNLIYIGPYRNNGIDGILSRIYLNSIQNKSAGRFSVYGRSLSYMVDMNKNTNVNIEETLPNNFDRCDAVISHSKPSELSFITKWTNICIPILDPKLYKASKYSHLQILNRCDHIIVNSEYEKQILLKSEIKKPIHVCYEDITSYMNKEFISQRYDFKSKLNDYYFGFIGYYSLNRPVIEKIITAFLIGYRADLSKKLVLFLRGTQTDKESIEKFILDTQNKLNIISNINIKIYFMDLEEKTCISAINSMDCLLALNEDSYLHLFDYYIAMQDKDCISISQFNNTEHSLEINNLYDTEDLLHSISVEDILSRMSNISHKKIKQKHSKNKHQSVGDAVCNILQ